MSSGDTLLNFEPYGGAPPGTSPAAIGVRNNHPILAFDDTTEESAYFSAVLPRAYGGSGLTVYVHWLAETATTNNVKWEGALERHQEDVDDLDADGFASGQTVEEVCASASGEPQVSAITFTDGAQIDSIAAGEHFRLRLKRLTSGLSGTNMTDDAQVIGIEIKET